MKQIDLNEWVLFGQGANGKTYRPADGSERLLLKVNKKEQSTYAFVKAEYDSSNAVRGMGIATPAMVEMVEVGKQYGVLFQRIPHKKSLCRICADDPDRIEEMATLFAQKGRELHAVECTNPLFSSALDHAREGLDFFSKFLNKSQLAVLARWIDEVPESHCCVHGDFNPGNLIVAGDETYWIDLGRFCYGHKMFDYAHLYLFAQLMSRTKVVQNISHLTEEQLKTFWRAFLKAEGIEGREAVEAFERQCRKYYVLDTLLRHSFQPNTVLAFLTAPRIRKFIAELER